MNFTAGVGGGINMRKSRCFDEAIEWIECEIKVIEGKIPEAKAFLFLGDAVVSQLERMAIKLRAAIAVLRAAEKVGIGQAIGGQLFFKRGEQALARAILRARKIHEKSTGTKGKKK